MLKLFRKIFGCYSDPEIASIVLPIPEEHITTVDTPVDETKEVIADIVSAVVKAKEGTHTSYAEDAMDQVTDGKFKFIKYRTVPVTTAKNKKVKVIVA